MKNPLDPQAIPGDPARLPGPARPYKRNWSPETIEKYRRLARERQLWLHSTGPKTIAGKAKVTENLPPGRHAGKVAELRRLAAARVQLGLEFDRLLAEAKARKARERAERG